MEMAWVESCLASGGDPERSLHERSQKLVLKNRCRRSHQAISLPVARGVKCAGTHLRLHSVPGSNSSRYGKKNN